MRPSTAFAAFEQLVCIAFQAMMSVLLFESERQCTDETRDVNIRDLVFREHPNIHAAE